MAKVVWIKPAEGLPEGPGYVLVEYSVPGGYTARGLASRTDGKPFYRPDPPVEADQEVAIQKAIDWADKNGVATVYVCSRTMA